jgi:aminoglycoside phosphotransferase family enzyme/predicted kinase
MPEPPLPLFIQALCDPAIHGNRAESVRLVETHISWVVLTGKYAYKIKKPVNFGFLDYSTLALRHKFCVDELRLNRRLAPSLYVDVVAITQEDGHFEIDGEGIVVEYAVKLKQFDETGLADRLIAENRITAKHIDELAQCLAAFHDVAQCSGSDEHYGSPETVLAAAEHNFDHLLRLCGELDPANKTPTPDFIRSQGGGSADSDGDSNLQQLNSLLAWTRSEFQRLSGVFQARKLAGFVRECHGDLHSGNLVLIDGRLVPFDCIEFSHDLRWIDCMSEIAFLFMDLEERGQVNLAWRLLNRYLEINGDYAGLEVLHFYTVYRALVRAKVGALALEKSVESSERRLLQDQCHRYLDYAGKAQAQKPALLITHGFSGSGKSFHSKWLAERLPAIRISSDTERKRLVHIGLTTVDTTVASNELYSDTMTRQIYQVLSDHAELLLNSGFNVLLDASFLAIAHRRHCMELAGRLGVRFFILDFPASVALLSERIVYRQQRGDDPSDADLGVLALQLNKADPLDALEVPFVLKVNTSEGADIDEILRKLVAC